MPEYPYSRQTIVYCLNRLLQACTIDKSKNFAEKLAKSSVSSLGFSREYTEHSFIYSFAWITVN